jgi:hypothetical protein
LGTRADLPITELSREDVLAFRTHLAETVATRIANHHLKTLKMIFKAARRTAFWPMTQPSSF